MTRAAATRTALLAAAREVSSASGSAEASIPDVLRLIEKIAT